MTGIEVIWILCFITGSIGIILHALGIYAIFHSKNRSSQTIILLNISIVDIICLLYGMANNTYRFIRFDESIYQSTKQMMQLLKNNLPPVYEEISFAIFYERGVQLIFIMSILTFDRLYCAVYPFHYRVRVKVSLVVKVLLSSWLCSFIMGAVYGIFQETRMILYYIGLGLAVSYIILAIVTYAVIHMKIRSSRRTFNEGRATENAISWKIYTMSALIVTTFLFFYCLPTAIRTFLIRYNSKGRITRTKCLLHEALSIVVNMGLISDAIIYLLLKKGASVKTIRDETRTVLG